jgi:hypothetical protein
MAVQEMKISLVRELFVSPIQQYRSLCARPVLGTKSHFRADSSPWYYANGLRKSVMYVVATRQRRKKEIRSA